MTKKQVLMVLIVGLLWAPLAKAELQSLASDSTQKTPTSDKMKTLFSSFKNPFKNKDGSPKLQYLGLYVAPEFQYGQVAGQGTTLAGASGMVLLNKHWGLGVAGYATTQRSFAPTSVGQRLGLWYGGAKIEYTVQPNRLVHLSFPLLVGRGNADNRQNDGWFGRGSRGSSFGVVQPGVNLEVNVLRFVKIFAGASYRFAVGVRNRDASLNLSNSQLSGLNTSIGLKMGLFDYALKSKKAPASSEK
jgi:hypothetical protein